LHSCVRLLRRRFSSSTAQEFDRSAPRPARQKYKLSDDELRSMGVARGDVPAFPNKCYGSVSISNEFLAPFRARGFSLEAVCLAITSPWVQYNPETGKPLPVSKDFLFVVPDCFKSGTPFLDCEFNHDHASGLKRTDAGRQGVHTRAVEVDAAVRRIIASGRSGNQCACDSLRWQGSQLRVLRRAPPAGWMPRRFASSRCRGGEFVPARWCSKLRAMPSKACRPRASPTTAVRHPAAARARLCLSDRLAGR
jgi:hypothetical protein